VYMYVTKLRVRENIKIDNVYIKNLGPYKVRLAVAKGAIQKSIVEKQEANAEISEQFEIILQGKAEFPVSGSTIYLKSKYARLSIRRTA